MAKKKMRYEYLTDAAQREMLDSTIKQIEADHFRAKLEAEAAGVETNQAVDDLEIRHAALVAKRAELSGS